MAVYRFRVMFEDYDDVWRDIEIKSIQTFEDFHHAIHSYIGFDASKPASFYISNDNWKKGQEITSRDLKGDEKERVKVMRKARLSNFIADPHQKIYYIFDPVAQWAFRIELIKILVNEEMGVSYPQCIKYMGEAPKQYSNIVTEPLPDPEDFDAKSAIEEGEEEGSADELRIADDVIPSIVVKDEDETIAPEDGDDEMIDQEPQEEDE